MLLGLAQNTPEMDVEEMVPILRVLMERHLSSLCQNHK